MTQRVQHMENITKTAPFMAYSHCTGTYTGLTAMGPNIFYRNVLTGLRQGKEPGSIVSNYAGPSPCSCPVIVQ